MRSGGGGAVRSQEVGEHGASLVGEQGMRLGSGGGGQELTLLAAKICPYQHNLPTFFFF